MGYDDDDDERPTGAAKSLASSACRQVTSTSNLVCMPSSLGGEHLDPTGGPTAQLHLPARQVEGTHLEQFGEGPEADGGHLHLRGGRLRARPRGREQGFSGVWRIVALVLREWSSVAVGEPGGAL